MSAATGQTADIIRNCYLTAVKLGTGLQQQVDRIHPHQYQNRLRLCPKDVWREVAVEFVELSTELAQQQLMTLTEQTNQLAALAQQVTLATADPLKTSLVPASTCRHATRWQE